MRPGFGGAGDEYLAAVDLDRVDPDQPARRRRRGAGGGAGSVCSRQRGLHLAFRLRRGGRSFGGGRRFGRRRAAASGGLAAAAGGCGSGSVIICDGLPGSSTSASTWPSGVSGTETTAVSTDMATTLSGAVARSTIW